MAESPGMLKSHGDVGSPFGFGRHNHQESSVFVYLSLFTSYLIFTVYTRCPLLVDHNTPSIDETENVILQCLNRDADWIKVSKKILVGLKADDELRLDPSKLAIRSAFDSARANQHQQAVIILDKAIDDTADDHVKAWLLSKKAAFQHIIDADGAQNTLVAAHRMEPGVTKPLHGATYKMLTPATELQAATLITNHQPRFLDTTGMKLFADELCSDLQFSENTSNTFEAAINDLAWFLGIRGQRPEKDYMKGPDNLWALPNGSFLVIECKNGTTSEKGISKKDAGQLGQSMDWFAAKYPASPSVPIMIHKERFLGQGASLVTSMRVIDPDGLEKLRRNLRGFSTQLADPDVMANASKIAQRLEQFELNTDAFVNGFSTLVKA